MRRALLLVTDDMPRFTPLQAAGQGHDCYCRCAATRNPPYSRIGRSCELVCLYWSLIRDEDCSVVDRCRRFAIPCRPKPASQRASFPNLELSLPKRVISVFLTGFGAKTARTNGPSRPISGKPFQALNCWSRGIVREGYHKAPAMEQRSQTSLRSSGFMNGSD